MNRSSDIPSCFRSECYEEAFRRVIVEAHPVGFTCTGKIVFVDLWRELRAMIVETGIPFSVPTNPTENWHDAQCTCSESSVH